MKLNALGRRVDGANNPNWKGGPIDKICEICGKEYQARRAQHKSRFCSLQCVGIFQRGRKKKPDSERKLDQIECEICGVSFFVYSCHKDRTYCCSRSCSYKRRSKKMAGDGNFNWVGGLSRLPYPWNFAIISRSIIERDGYKCQNPNCTGADKRLTTHHINYDKQDCRPENLIALCSACNSKANFGRDKWMCFYQAIVSKILGLPLKQEF